MELKTTISQDVIRTFPSLLLFRDPKVQEVLERILFIWCKLNPDIGYRQGMHELVAVIYYVVSQDARCLSDPEYNSIVDDQFVEHDTGILFLSLMRSVKPWYEINQSEYFDKVMDLV
jgi:TBC1 domain family protein 5